MNHKILPLVMAITILCGCHAVEDARTLEDVCLEAEACVPDVCGTYDRPAYEECMASDVDYCKALFGVDVWLDCAHECLYWTTSETAGPEFEAAGWGRALGMYTQIGYHEGESCSDRYGADE